jgi:hypothetical protein
VIVPVLSDEAKAYTGNLRHRQHISSWNFSTPTALHADETLLVLTNFLVFQTVASISLRTS